MTRITFLSSLGKDFTIENRLKRVQEMCQSLRAHDWKKHFPNLAVKKHRFRAETIVKPVTRCYFEKWNQIIEEFVAKQFLEIAGNHFRLRECFTCSLPRQATPKLRILSARKRKAARAERKLFRATWTHIFRARWDLNYLLPPAAGLHPIE